MPVDCRRDAEARLPSQALFLRLAHGPASREGRHGGSGGGASLSHRIGIGSLVSSDIIGDARASVVDLELAKVIDGDLVKVMSW